MMFDKIGFQQYTVRDYMIDPDVADHAFAKLAKIGYTQIHTAHASPAFDEKTLGELCKKHGISIIGSHYDWNKIQKDPEGVMELHNLWGTKNIGIGGMPQAARTDLGELKTFIKQFNETAEIYAKHGFRLGYHNHYFEFIRVDGKKTMMDLLVENLDPKNTSFILDIAWLVAGSADVEDWIYKLDGRIDILHLKDLFHLADGRRLYPKATELGNGMVNLDKALKAAKATAVKYYIVEQDEFYSPNAVESLKISADFLKKYMD
ncbi:MAG: TIM barrel protein [Clostridia bacterium]|nr:TIM barrel protein [Clostridia bacterium]